MRSKRGDRQEKEEMGNRGDSEEIDRGEKMRDRRERERR